ncbi:hypothetical protein E4T43_03811 [Aureobasidium subglaciale]|nr:hypothetical protein E4T43_03811 [Aureobasidium subglaciale]
MTANTTLEHRWLDELDRGSPSAFAAFSLVYLRRLKIFEISAEFTGLFSFIDTFIIQGLVNLDTMSSGTFDEAVYIAPGRAPSIRSKTLNQLLYFYLPSVRHLSLNVPELLEGLQFEWPAKDSLPPTTKIESLNLTFTFLNENSLAHLIEACPMLRIPQYDLWTTMDPMNDNERPEEALVDLDVLSRSLSSSKSTLEVFHLHIGKYSRRSGVWNDYFDHIHGHMSFHDYTQLRTLHVPLQALVGSREQPANLTSKLPKSLTTLWINLDGFDFPEEDEPGTMPMHSTEAIISIVSDYLNQWNLHTPLLKNLKLLVYQVPYLVWDQWDPDLLSDILVPLGQEVGVQVCVDVVQYRCMCVDPGTFDLARQGPPYFSQEVIDAHQMEEKGPNSGSHYIPLGVDLDQS